MIAYALASENPDLSTESRVRMACRCLFLACVPSGSTSANDDVMMGNLRLANDVVMTVSDAHEMLISNKSEMGKFYDLFTISASERKTLMDSISEGSYYTVSNLMPSVLRLKTYQELVAAGVFIEEEDL